MRQRRANQFHFSTVRAAAAVRAQMFTPEKAQLDTKCDLVSLSLVSYNEPG